MRQTFPISLLDPSKLEQIGVGFRAVQGETMMHLVVTSKSRHVDLGSESKTRHQFVSIVIQDNCAHFMQSFLVLTPFVGSVIVQGGVGCLDSITCGKINADHHCHLQTRGQEICKFVFNRLPEILEHGDSLLFSAFCQSQPVLPILQSCQVEVALSNN